MDSPEVSAFRKTLFAISRELTDDEVRELKYLCNDHLTVKQGEDIKKDALRLFEILEQKGIISEDNFTFLVKRMEDLQRYDLRKKLLDIMPGAGNFPDQNALGNPPPTLPPNLEPVHQQETLKHPSFFTPTSTHVKSEGAKTLRSLSNGQSSTCPPSNSTRGIYGVDSPISTSGDGQSTQHRPCARSTSLQNNPSGQSSHEAAYSKVRASSLDKNRSAGSAQFSLRHCLTSGSPGSGFGSAKKQNSGNLSEGPSIEGKLENLSLQNSGQLAKTSRSPGIPDDDIETDSPMPEGPTSTSTQSITGQGRGSATPSRMTPGTGALSRSHPWEMWDSYNEAEWVRESRHPRGTSSPQQGHQQSAPRPLALSDGISSHPRQVGYPPEMSPEEQVCCTNQMIYQRDARAADQKDPDLREYPRELAERPLLNQSPTSNQPVRESRQPGGISSSRQSQGSTSSPLLDLSTDSPNNTGRNEILENPRMAEAAAERQQPMTSLDRITIHCKECSALICKASELRRKGNAGHVTCTSPEFKKWVKEMKYARPLRYKDCESIGLISCGTLDCGNQLGTMQKFLKLQPPDGYALKAQSFKIHFEMGGVKIPTMWKKAGFQILQG